MTRSAVRSRCRAAGQGDQRLHERRAERVGQPERPAVGAGRHQGRAMSWRTWSICAKAASICARAASSLRPQHPLRGDHRQVAVRQLDRAEPALPPLEAVGERQVLGAGQAGADQLPQVPLPGDEADDRHRPGRRSRPRPAWPPSAPPAPPSGGRSSGSRTTGSARRGTAPGRRSRGLRRAG